jgi:hypothetical protein
MKSITTITALVAALAVTSGGLGLSLTGVFDDNNVTTTSNTVNGLMMGHLVVEAHNEAGELVAYRQSDNEVVDDGEQCILKMLFATSGQTEAGRGEYASTTACTGALTNAWDVIAIGTDTTAAADTQVILGNETGSGTNNAAGMPGLERGTATTKTWTNGTGATTTKIVLSKTFTNGSTESATIAESGLFNSTSNDTNGMLARQTFTGVALSTGDSITITWTFTVGN